jgi:FMN reductase
MPGGPTCLGVVASPAPASRTETLVAAVVRAATGGAGQVINLHEVGLPVADGTPADRREGRTKELLEALDSADAVVLGTPIYRASMSGLMKDFLDLVPRGEYDGPTAPLRAKPVAVVATAAAREHYLGADQLVSILHGFFASLVVPPTLFGTHADVDPGGEIAAELATAAELVGKGLAELSSALTTAPALRSAKPRV